MACNERGMALISVILILTVLLGMAHVLAEKVWQSTRQTADAASREQTFWAAQAGIETARQQLAVHYSGSGSWQTFLASAVPESYPATPAWVSEVNGITVELYVRDNPDGDGDLRVDNDLKVFVLAHARGRLGAEAMVESLCGFTAPLPGGLNQAGTSETVELSGQPVSTYEIAD